MRLIILSLCVSLFHQTVYGIHFSFGRNLEDNTFSPLPKTISEQANVLSSVSEPSEIQNSSGYRSEEEYSSVFPNKTLFQTDQNISTLSSSYQTLPSTYSNASGTSNTDNAGTLTSIFSNESYPQSSTQFHVSESSTTTDAGTNFTATSVVSSSSSKTGNVTSTPPVLEDEDEEEGVARGKPSTTETPSNNTSLSPSIYQQAWTVISDTYTLSIIVPVAAGIVFASSIILTIATCRCLRRRCIRRRLRKKTLPDSVKNLRPSDRARLLADTSDEEF